MGPAELNYILTGRGYKLFDKPGKVIIFLAILSRLFLPAGSGMSSEPGEGMKFNVESPREDAPGDNVNIEYWENGKARVLTECNDLGNVIGIAYFRVDGSLELEKTFDDRGKQKTMAYFDSRGGLKTGPDGWAAIVWQYENGVMRGQGYYDDSGKLTRYKVYNAAGDLVCKKYIGDEEPDLNELYSTRSTTRAPQSFEFYDSSGRPAGKVTTYRGDDWFPYTYPYWHYDRYPSGYTYLQRG